MTRRVTAIGDPEIVALKILAESPRGASSYHLVTRHGVAPAAIFNIVDQGLAQPHEQELAGYKVSWLTISDAGRTLLNQLKRQTKMRQLSAANCFN
jgi:hypothetical protein